MLAGQIVKMVEGFPEYLDSVINWVNTTFHTELSPRGRSRTACCTPTGCRSTSRTAPTGVLDVSTTVLGGLFQLLTIALFSFYFAADGPRLRRALCSVLPPARQAEVLRAWEIAVDKTGGYLYSRGLMALISGVAHYILLEVLGVPVRARARRVGGPGLAVHPDHRHLSRGRPADADRVHRRPLVRAVGARSSSWSTSSSRTTCCSPS